MPGSLALDALCQLLGLYLGWLGYKGKGRAFGVGEVKYKGDYCRMRAKSLITSTLKIVKRPSCKIRSRELQNQCNLAISFLAIYLGYIPAMNCSIFYLIKYTKFCILTT